MVVLQLGKVEVGGGALLNKVVDVVVEVHAEVKEGAGGDLVINHDMSLVEVPASGTDKESGELGRRR